MLNTDQLTSERNELSFVQIAKNPIELMIRVMEARLMNQRREAIFYNSRKYWIGN